MDIINIKKKYRLIIEPTQLTNINTKIKYRLSSNELVNVGGSKKKKQSAGSFNGINPTVIKSDNEDKKCAPSKELTFNSCYLLEDLIDMCNAFNIYVDMKLINKPKINISNSKEQLVLQLDDRLNDTCLDQLCWSKQEFIRLANNKKSIKENTFRPSGPNGQFTWLNTSNITQVLEQHHDVYPNFKYLGTVPMDFDKLPQLGIKNLDFDELYNNNIHQIGIVFNTDNHNESGSHWIALFANINEFKIYYFDSYGLPPEDRVRILVNRIAKWCCIKHNKPITEPNDIFMNDDHKIKNNIESLDNVDIRFNTNRHQYKGSECGVYCMNFILRMLKGETFDEYNKNKLLDDTVNQCRQKYFIVDNNNDNDD